MTAVIHIDPVTGDVIVTVSGKHSLDEWKMILRELWEHPEYKGTPVLWDLRATVFSLSAEEVRQLAQFVRGAKERGLPSKTAFVVSGNLGFGLLRMYELLSEELQVQWRVFRSLDEAIRWLKER